MKKYLITNSKAEYPSYTVNDWDTFFRLATSADGFNIDNGDLLFIDVLALPDENIASTLKQGIPDSQFIMLDKETPIPSWFTLDLADTPTDLRSDLVSDSQNEQIVDALDMIQGIGEGSDSNTDTNYGKIITFGSAKGGSGKTFTSIITAVYYAKEHENEKVCLLDLDVEEPQIAPVLKAPSNRIKTIRDYFVDYTTGNKTFEALKKCKYNRTNLPPNLDFYLSPRGSNPINDEDFWLNLMTHLFTNYDLVILDTGTTYMTTMPIIYAYKIADKINLVSMVSLASSAAVSYQLKLLKGVIPNPVYSAEDELESKLNLIITNYSAQDKVTKDLVKVMDDQCPIIAVFGHLHDKINEIEILGRWDLLDGEEKFRNGIRKIYA